MSATCAMNPNACTNESKTSCRRSDAPSSSHPSSAATRSETSSGERGRRSTGMFRAYGTKRERSDKRPVTEGVGEGIDVVGLLRLSLGVGPRRVAGSFELRCQLGAAAGLDTAVGEDVHVIGVEHVEQALVVGDGEYPEIELFGRLFDAAAHEAQGIDVEARVELVEHGDLGPQHGELKGLDPLLLAA